MLEFIIVTPIVYLLYYIFMISKYDDNGKLKEKKRSAFMATLINRIKLFFFSAKSEKEEILTRGRKNKKIKEAKEDIKFPTEVEILIAKYHVDLKKINYKRLLKMIGLMCALDMGIILGIISYVPTDNIYLQIGAGAVIMIPTILIGYAVLGNYLKKKGLTKNV